MVYAIIFAGGIGSRLGSDIPKQFLNIDNVPILVRTINKFNLNQHIDKILVVSKKEYVDKTKALVKSYNLNKVIDVIPGGETAFESQSFGINYVYTIAKPEDIVLVHDGVRPFINDQIISDCINLVKEKGSAITVSPAIETIALVNDENVINKTVPRQKCLVARAPQAFYLNDLYNAHKKAKQENKSYIDSASMMLDQGFSLNPICGPNENIKITTQYDYEIAQYLAKQEK